MAGLLFLLAAAAAGALAGLAYFSVLRATLQRLPASRSPWRLMLGGYLLRVTLALAVFSAFMPGPGERLAAAFIAFLIARSVVIRRGLGREA